MSKEDELLTFISDMAHEVFNKAHEDSVIYGAGYIRLKDGIIENVSPLEFEKEMIHILENMYKGKE